MRLFLPQDKEVRSRGHNSEVLGVWLLPPCPSFLYHPFSLSPFCFPGHFHSEAEGGDGALSSVSPPHRCKDTQEAGVSLVFSDRGKNFNFLNFF